MARTEYLAALRQDVGYALRALRRMPGFTAVAIVTLALGIGANTAIFSVVHGVLLETLPFRDPDLLYRVRTLYPDGTPYSLSPPDFMSVREASRVFEQVDAYTTAAQTLLGSGEPKEVRAAIVSDGLFSLLGLQVAVGRGFLPEENRPGASRALILDHGFWQREFGGDRAVLGRTLTVGGRPSTIVGVLAQGARLPVVADLIAPLEYGPTFNAATATGRRGEFLAVVGLAKSGVSAEQIASDLLRIGTHLQRVFPQTNATLTFNATPLRTLMLGDVERPLLVLLAAVGFVLLVACANVANLLLARASARRQELAVRAALGAGRGRLLRQLLTEAVVLGLAGGTVGLLIAYWGTRALVAAQPADIPRLEEVGVNGPVVVFALAVAVITSLGFGLFPALQSTGALLTQGLREGGRGGSGSSGQRMRATFVVAEIALAVVLLTGAGLLIRSFVELMRVDPGFQSQHAIAIRLTLQGEAYQRIEQVRARVSDLQDRLRALPGVTVVGVTTMLPLSGRGSMVDFAVDGAPPPPPDMNAEIAIVSVTPDYFRSIGTPLRRGRFFSDRDHSETPLVALMNDAGVRRWFAGQNPIGRRVTMSGRSYEIVGVVGDVLHSDPGEPAAPHIFTPYAQRTARSVRIVVRTAGDPLAQAPAFRAAVRAVDANLAIPDITPLEQLVATSLARPRFYTALLALFAAVALALAATGVYGVMSYAVAQRTREISVRMALGALKGDVVRMVVGQAILLASVGLLVGIAAALAVGRVLQDQLFGVTLVDPVTLGAVAFVLGASAATASFVPARRAASLEPASALREG
jgi:putative ABC transport system permease protein